MERFRVGYLRSLVCDYGWVIQKRKWYGWSDWKLYYDKESALVECKRLECNGHTVEYY